MKKQIQMLLTSVSLTLTTAACSIDTMPATHVKAESVHQSYYLTYKEEENRTQADAQFRAGGSTGTTLDLDGKSTIRMNGQPMVKQTFLGTRYQASINGFLSRATFEYMDIDGHVYANSVEIRPLHLSIGLASVPRNRTFSVSVEARDLAHNEDISGQLTQTQGSTGSPTTTLYGKYDRSTQSLVFSAAETATLQPGSATLVVSRNVNVRAQFATAAGGFIYGSYVARPVQLPVEGGSNSLGLARK